MANFERTNVISTEYSAIGGKNSVVRDRKLDLCDDSGRRTRRGFIQVDVHTGV